MCALMDCALTWQTRRPFKVVPSCLLVVHVVVVVDGVVKEVIKVVSVQSVNLERIMLLVESECHFLAVTAAR